MRAETRKKARNMTRREKLIRNKNLILWRISELDRCIFELGQSGTASASVSAGGGSQSYTHADLEKLEKLRGIYAGRIAAINDALRGGDGTGIRKVMTTRGGLW